MNLKLYTIFFLLLLGACASKDITITPDHFKIIEDSTKLDAESLRELTTQAGSLGVAGYYVSAYPLTHKYIDLLKKDNKTIDILKELKNCFFVHLNTKVDNKNHALFENWPAKFIDHNKKEQDIIWTKSTLKKEPLSKKIPSYHGIKEQWFNEGIGCTDETQDLTHDFKLVLKPKEVTWLLRGSITLKWEVTPYEVVDGKKIIKPKKKQKTQPYRSW